MWSCKISRGCILDYQARDRDTQGQLKLTHTNFFILNSYVKAIFKIYQIHLFLGG